MTDSTYKPNVGKGTKATAGVVAAAMALAVPMIAKWEGKSNVPHWDNIGKVWDVCYGDTAAEKRTYSDSECLMLLRVRAEQDYARPLLKCVPGLADRPNQFAASAVFAYNMGVGNFCRSSVERKFNAGDWRGGCDALRQWNGKIAPKPDPRAVSSRKLSKGRWFNVYRGLVNRREDERRLCLKGL